MKNEKLIHALGNCINHCNYCADACLDEENVKMMVNCIRTDRVCAEVCSTLNQLLATGFKDVDDLVRYCAKICDTCADECSQHEAKHCQDCAEACRKCAEECRNYLA
ncbi:MULTISPECIES: four-helix bundle copper-binding protein [Aequorivita]|uniref:Four-helix bundle copper-binding protein n=1 Tax=Aequorivita iocasae TaxID=2803865 RepID=A0ABX7DS79_9FLAO|nr:MULTISPECIES: four-helix bundle copper-binding protein [Aequorivita]QQX77016.1 four-helix bundle copper-binding protein [Aequorivita iocasae]UCA56495.1 four-helix bundle copper-binding protein [Aequorivita sp. F7]